jgi:hypothetical protein
MLQGGKPQMESKTKKHRFSSTSIGPNLWSFGLQPTHSQPRSHCHSKATLSSRVHPVLSDMMITHRNVSNSLIGSHGKVKEWWRHGYLGGGGKWTWCPRLPLVGSLWSELNGPPCNKHERTNERSINQLHVVFSGLDTYKNLDLANAIP